MSSIETRIAGIPCIVELLEYSAPTPHHITADPGTSSEGNSGYLSFRVLDRKGYKAEWLAAKMTDDDEDRIKGELLTEMHSEAEDYRDCY